MNEWENIHLSIETDDEVYKKVAEALVIAVQRDDSPSADKEFALMNFGALFLKRQPKKAQERKETAYLKNYAQALPAAKRKDIRKKWI